MIAEKIVSKDGAALEEKTLNFSKLVKQIKDGVIDVKELQEQRDAEISQMNEDDSVKKKRVKK